MITRESVIWELKNMAYETHEANNAFDKHIYIFEENEDNPEATPRSIAFDIDEAEMQNGMDEEEFARGGAVKVDLTNATVEEQFRGIVDALERAHISARVKLVHTQQPTFKKHPIAIELGMDYRNDRAVEKAIEKYTGINYNHYVYSIMATTSDPGLKVERIYGKKNISRALYANGGGISGMRVTQKEIREMVKELKRAKSDIQEHRQELKVNITDFERERIEEHLRAATERYDYFYNQLEFALKRYMWSTGKSVAFDKSTYDFIKQEGFSNGGELFADGGSVSDSVDTLTMDIPLFIRLLEYAKEEAKSDMDLHRITENATIMSKTKKSLTMNDYDGILVLGKFANGGDVNENSDIRGKKGYVVDKDYAEKGTAWYLIVEIDGRDERIWHGAESNWPTRKEAQDYAISKGVILEKVYANGGGISGTHCDRCGQPANTRTMSMFNTQMICMPCKKLERENPRYQQAVEAELQAVKSGNYNFPGIGLE